MQQIKLNAKGLKGMRFIIILILAILYLGYISLSFLEIPPDSDYASLVIEANDILSGNIFLRDWNLTGISFLTTDLLFFIVSSLFFRMDVGSYYMASILLFIGMVFSSFLLYKTDGKKINLKDMLVFLAVAGLPNFLFRNCSRAHSGVYCLLFIFIWAAGKFESPQPNIKYLVIMLVCTVMSVMGDAIFLLLGFVPLCISAIYTWFGENKVQKKQLGYMLLLTAAGIVLGTLLEKAYFMIGGANKNEFLSQKLFRPLDEIVAGFSIYIDSIFGIMGASFWGSQIVSARTGIYFLRVLIVLAVFSLIFYNVVCYFKRKPGYFVDFMLSCGFITMSIVYIITDISANVLTARYFAGAPMLFAVLIVRFMKRSCFFSRQTEPDTVHGAVVRKKINACVALALTIVVIFSFSLPKGKPGEDFIYDDMAIFLEENGLTSGYASFWNTSVVMLMSNNRVRVRSVVPAAFPSGQHTLTSFGRFCKNAWYDEPANFILVNESDMHGVTRAFVEDAFGVPERTLTFLDYDVLIYARDLSPALLK